MHSIRYNMAMSITNSDTNTNIDDSKNNILNLLIDERLSSVKDYLGKGYFLKLVSIHPKLRALNEGDTTSLLCTSAARRGDIDALKWVHENYCPWNKWTCRMAALGGHFEVLQWARKNRCPWDEMDLYYGCFRWSF